jgi:hypothetical protein
MEEPATIAIPVSPQRRSRVGVNPWTAINRNTRHGRHVHDIAVRLLATAADPSDPLVVADAIALAELRVRADEARRDPGCDIEQVVRLEGLVDRRMRRFGRQREPARPSLQDYVKAKSAGATP